MLRLSLLLFLSSTIMISNCFYTHLFLNQPKCFYENLYEGMNVIFRYEISSADSHELTSYDSADRFFIEVFSGGKKISTTYKSGKTSSKYSLIIEKGGEYKFCIKTDDKKLFGKSKFVKLNFMIDSSGDSHEEELKKSIKMKDFNMVNKKITNFISKINIIEATQKYKDRKDIQFANDQIYESNLIVIMSIIQISIICLIGLIHIFRLRSLFKKKIWSPF